MAETDTILDNQEVTAQTLNDIAIDLGYTSFNGFGENKFGADELNGITSALVSSGILSSDNKCEPYISDGKVYINTGIIVFANGSKKKITEPVELDLVAGTYIYALNDITHNKCRIVVSDVAPDDGDFVNLCEISSAEVLVDKRVVAKAKVELPTEGNSYSFTENINSTNIAEYNAKTFNIPIDGSSKIFIDEKFSTGGLGASYVYDIESQSFDGVYYRNGDYANYQQISGKMCLMLYGGSTYVYIYLEVEEQTESTITFKYTVDMNAWPWSGVSLNVNFYIYGGI